MLRREFIKSGLGALATLGVGEVILLGAGDAMAAAPDPLNYATDADGAAHKVRPDYRTATSVKSVCLNCSTVCGIEGFVQDGRVVKIRGNPLDPNLGSFMTCAKGQSGPTINNYPERLLFPLRRVGKRGEGLWRRITWEEAYAEMATRIRRCIDDGHPERVAIHQGRSRYESEIGRFLNAIGSPVLLNHRALCSSNKRAANYVSLGETDWESIDAERCRYFLNFGANFFEAHQGGLHLVKRVTKARFDHGAKLVTFDVRMSNTAGRSDEWFQPYPGTEGAIALAMGHVILRENLHDRAFVADYVQPGEARLREWLASCTPAWAAQLSGVPAADIERLAIEFASAKPAVAAFTNRGTGAHYNGFNAERAVVMLNALVGSVGKPGGYCYGLEEKLSPAKYPAPQPEPPKVTIRTDLEDPPEWPLANRWQKMKVGQVVYDYLKEGRARLDVYISYTIAAPMTWPEGRTTAAEVLADEKLIPFHACSDIVYSEMAHYADLILPDATYLERWGMDIRNNLELRHYVMLRQPMVPPPGEAVSFPDVLFNIGKRLGPDQAKYFAFGTHEDYVRAQCSKLPTKGPDGRAFASGFEYMKHYGVHVDAGPKAYEVYRRALSAEQLAGSRVDEASGRVLKADKPGGKERAIGLMVGGVAVRGFATPSRRFEIHAPEVAQVAAAAGMRDDGLPSFHHVPGLESLPADRYVLTSFKWNVHTQGRTASQKYLAEIVHDNPMWMHPSVAARIGVKSGDMVELTTYRPRSGTAGDKAFKGGAAGKDAVVGRARIRVFVTQGIHPKVLAVSNSLGWKFGGRAAQGRNGNRTAVLRASGQGATVAALGPEPRHDDLRNGVWWDERNGGRGNGVNINAILPVNPSPLVGMQAWFDTVCSVRRV
ncbi:anaerobic selenocysteine-containing dehydrogenase [Pseudoduganella flava]|uniref:Anaerobic selenocysteine-containing dehydrogenase n=1 Tax=Pseudoduganella flava TaxID=871742 RepID=A0A562Q0T6_9BURK|nr:molybdopterin-dependent oxidoreductase [Pseudoduganella flava]QGZ38196.1 molybdopterin-dependent oxidoreductase [Pseudoduganella flava]TWI50277.1 anaerobic selenocysteine-containing dehydrogenase [Pseudoduganella flava]